MKISQEILATSIHQIEQLGYKVKLECTNANKPQQVQQLHVYKDGRCVAELSLMLACRLNMMKNGVGRKELPLFKILYNLSSQI